MDGRRALVTGATGTIGAALTRRLVNVGWTVTVLTRAGSAQDRLQPVRERIDVAIVDWPDSASVARAVAQARPDVVFHLAGPPFNPPRLPPSVFLAAVDHAAMLVRALDDAGSGARIVFSSSAAVYGNAAHASETQAPAPATWLGAAKAMAGVLFATAGRTTGRPIVELRLYTPYGPGERPERLIPSVIAAALAGRPIPLSEGTQERDFVYIDDVVDALLAAARVDAPAPLTFNIGSGTGTRVRDVVTAVLAMLDAGDLARFGALPMRPDEIMHMAADVSAAAAGLGWTPHTSLHDGLRSTIEWFKHDALHRV